MTRFLRLAVVALFALMAGTAAATGEEAAFITTPPADYRRPVVIAVSDLEGSPLPGVVIQVTPQWGRAYPQSDIVTDELGRARFEIQPVVENPLKDKKVTDRFLTYRAVFFYRLVKDGYMETVGEKEDVQEFASYAHPLYYGLNRTPSDEPLIIREQVAAYEDFLINPGRQPDLRPLIEALMENGPASDIRLVPGSMGLGRDGRLQIGFRFLPLFDPEQYGLAEAGRVLLKKPIRDCLNIITHEYADRAHIGQYEFHVEAGFQYRNNPFPEPVAQTYVIRIPARAASAIQAWQPGSALPGEGVQVKVVERNLDLTTELWP